MVLLALDLLGTLLFMLGAVGEFGGGATGSSLANWLLMTLGIGLIVPYLVHVISKGRQSAP